MKEIKRLSQHLQCTPCGEGLSAAQRLELIRHEHERGHSAILSNVSIDELRKNFPENWTDVGTMLRKMHIPVYSVESTHPRRVRTLTSLHIGKLGKERSTSVSTDPVAPMERQRDDEDKHVQPSTSSGYSKTSIEPATRFTVTDIQVEDEEEVVPVVNLKTTHLSPARPSVEVDVEVCRSRPRLRTKRMRISSESPDIPTSRTKCVHLDYEEELHSSGSEYCPDNKEYSEEEDVTMGSSDEEVRRAASRIDTPVANRRARIREAMVSHNLYVSPTDARQIEEQNPHVIKISNFLKIKHPKKTVSVENDIRNIIRLMAFVSPGHKVCKFTWGCLADTDLINTLFNTLREEIQLDPQTTANYHKSFKKMVTVALSDIDFRASEPQVYDHLVTSQFTFNEQRKGTGKQLARSRMQKKVKMSYNDPSTAETTFLNIFNNLEKVKKLAVPIIHKAKDKRINLNEHDLFIVNGFFLLYSTLSIGNRPAVFQNMPLSVFDMAEKCRQVREDGTAYYFLATAEHKTSTTELAYIYVEDEDWELFRIYRQNIRRKPAKEDADVLFLNTNGKRIYNPSHDVKKLLSRYGVQVMTITEARHAIETVSKARLTKAEHEIINKMLTHSSETAERMYMDPHAADVPHIKGLPLLGRMQRDLATKHGVEVHSFLERCTEMGGSLAQRDEPVNCPATSTSTSLSAPVQVPSTRRSLPAPVQVPSKKKIKTTKPAPELKFKTENEKMKHLIQHSSSLKCGPDDSLPTAKEYREAANEFSEYELATDEAAAKRFHAICTYQQRIKRAEEFAAHYRRSNIKTDRLDETVLSYVTQRGWKWSDTLKQSCRLKYTKEMEVREAATRAKPIIPLQEQQLQKQVDAQQWTLATIRKASDEKGCGLFAANDITKKELICDYHGMLVSDEEGWRRYNAYGDKGSNSYMYQFEVDSVKYWIDANEQCQCHPTKKLKGRMCNFSRKNANVLPKVMTINGKPHIFLYAKKDIAVNTELLFDYGVYKDKHSAQEPWMKQ
ncbi:MAG: SET domain-containing protein-lysine N-methyltransferase [Sedimenticola sp.]